jgi:hypothetical protein
LLKRSYAKGLAGSWKTWPPLPGSYRVLRYHAPVAVCTLNSDELIEPLASTKRRELARAEHALQTGESYVQDAAPE